MTTPAPVSPLSIEDYDAIEAAVMETARGRWFLTEYARRNRNSDTDQILTKLERLERTIRRDRAVPDIDRIRLDLADMAEAISRTKQEIAQMKFDTENGRFADASAELDAIVTQTENATNDILRAAETVQEAAWTLREAGAADEMCDTLDAQATDIYTACSFQDLTGQRTRKVVTVLRYLESRITAMISIWGLDDESDDDGTIDEVAPTAPFDPADTRPDAHLLNGPQLHGRGIAQSDVDDLMWDEGVAAVSVAEPDFADEAMAAAEAAPAEETAEVEPTPEVEIAAAPRARSTPLADADLSAADVFATADVFAPVDAGRIAAPAMFETDVTGDAIAAEEMVIQETVQVGNTVRTVETVAVVAAETAPALAVVPAEDPIAALEPAERLIVFG